VPAIPYRGIQPFRYADHAIFFAREEETRLLTSLMAVYRGVFLYGDSGNGKSSLINAGLLPEACRLGFEPVRVRVQPRPQEELVIEQIAVSDEGGEVLPSVMAPEANAGERVVLSIAEFQARVREASRQHRPLVVFDQFEEIETLFEDPQAVAMRRALVEMIVGLLGETLPVKLLFAFREDYLGRVKRLLAARPELSDQELRLGPLSAGALKTIIRGPFERFPERYARELDEGLAQRLQGELAERFGSGDVSLSEVQTVCLRLWQSPDPQALLDDKHVQGLLEDELGEALEGFPGDQRPAAIALLSQMITSAGTRNVISAEDLRQRVRDEEPDIAPALLDDALDRLERDSKLVRRERRRDIHLYEITSEFLVPWISQRREELRLAHERRRERRRLRILATSTASLLIIVALIAALAIWALDQRGHARRQATQARSLALTSSASALLRSRPDVSLLLASEAYRTSPRLEARSAALAALTVARDPGVVAILHGHTDTVFSIAFDRDRRTLASGGADGTVRLWDARTHRQLGEPLRGHTDRVFSVAFSRDGRTLASAGGDGTVRLWDARTHKELGRPLRGHTRVVGGVAFSPDGRTLASASSDRTVRLWDVRTHEALGTLTGHTAIVESVAFSPDGRTLASGGDDRTVRLWDVRTHEQLGRALTGHEGRVFSVAFGRGGRTLASAGADRTVRVWDARTHRQLGQPLTGHVGSVESVAFAPDGRVLASGGADKTIRMWDPRISHQLGEPLRGHTDSVQSVAFSPDGRTLASGGVDKTLRVWDVIAHRQVGEPLRGHTDSVQSVAFSPDGRTLVSGAGTPRASGGGDTTIRLWDVRSHRQLGRPLTGHTNTVFSVAFSRDGRTLASAGGDRTVRLWDTRTHKQLGEPLRGHADYVLSVAFSPDRRMLASAGGDPAASGGGDRTVRLWDVRTHRQLGEPLVGHTDVVWSVAFSPDGRTLASGSSDGTVRLWDVRTRRQLGAPLTGHTDVVVQSVAFSPDGRTLVSGSRDGTVRLWDVRTHTQIGMQLTGHADRVNSVAFSPDGRTLASASDDRTVRVWENILWRNFAGLQSEVCKLVGSGLSITEWAQYGPGIPYHQTCP
jgi:WD40 repeat protein